MAQDICLLLGERRDQKGRGNVEAKTLAPQHNCIHAQAAAKKQFTENYLPLTLKKLETTAALNDSKEGWIKGDKVMTDKLFVTVDNQDYGYPIHFSLLLMSSLYSFDNTHLHIR